MGIRSSPGAMNAVFQRRPWLNWVTAFVLPMGFFLIDKLATLSALLRMTTTNIEPETSRIIAGLSLGLLEDLLTTCVLVGALVIVELIGLLASKLILPCVGEHHHTTLLVKGVGHAIRFVAVLALVILALLPFAADMAVVRSHQVRLSINRTEPLDNEKTGTKSHVETTTIVSTLFFALALTATFVGVLNLIYWWPSQEMAVKTELPTARFSTPTYLDIRFAAHNTPPTDVELGSPVRSDHGVADPNVTIVAAPSEPDDDMINFELSRVNDKPSQAIRPRYPPAESLLVAIALFGVFVLLLDVTLAISQTSSPTIASIGLNASLNEIFHTVFNDCLTPGGC